MAYNPFSIFRRNQKAIFAVITVFIMFTFVLSSGLGGGLDFFDWFPRMLGGARKGDVICTIDGSKVYTGDLQRLREQRVYANRFMDMAAEQTRQNLYQFAYDQLPRLTPENRQAINQVLNTDQQIARFGGNPELVSMILQMNARTLQGIITSPTAKPEDKDAARALQTAFLLSQMRAAGGGRHYFVNLPNRSERDLVQFMLWEKKADQLGIRFSTEDVKQLIQKEFLGQFRSDVPVREALRKEFGDRFNLDATLRGIGAEFRVRAAQTAVLGPVMDRSDRTQTAAPVFTPAYELFDFYRDKASPTSYAMLAVPVGAFTHAVTAQPTDRELQDLFNKYKDQEPNPAREEPGFKEPRKVKLEWITAKGDEPYYTKAAEEWLAQGEARARISGMLTVPVPGTGPAWAAAAAAPLAMKDPLVHSAYETTVVGPHRSQTRFRWEVAGVNTINSRDILDTSVVRPANLAALAGGLAGALLTQSNPYAAAAPLVGGAIAHELRDWIRAGMPLVLGAIPGPGLFATVVGGEAAYRQALPQPLPLEAVRPELMKDLTARKAREFMALDLNKLREDVAKLATEVKERDKRTARAKEMLAEFAKARGLTIGATKDLVDEWTAEDDPDLAPLKAAFKSPHRDVPARFGVKFFWVENPQTGTRSAATGLYQPEFYPNPPNPDASPMAKPEPVFLAWRTEEKPARTLTFREAEPKVREAWREMKARELAKAEAERIANDIRTGPATSPFQVEQSLRDTAERLRAQAADPKAKDRVKVFHLDNVAPLAPAPTDLSFTSQPGGVQPFQLSPSANMPYPTQEMVNQLIENRTKPIKTTLVLPDQPKDTFYVAAVLDRREKTVEDFRLSVFSETGTAAARGMVMRAHASESVRKAQESILELLKREFNYAETEEQKARLDKSDREGTVD